MRRCAFDLPVSRRQSEEGPHFPFAIRHGGHHLRSSSGARRGGGGIALLGGGPVAVDHGGGVRRKDPAFLAQFDMVVTTYGVVQMLGRGGLGAAFSPSGGRCVV